MSKKELPGLSKGQLERLALLSEELGEAQQAIGKVLRHGYNSMHPDGGPSNRRALEKELGDVLAAMELLFATTDIYIHCVAISKREKLERVGEYLHHQRKATLSAARGRL